MRMHSLLQLQLLVANSGNTSALDGTQVGNLTPRGLEMLKKELKITMLSQKPKEKVFRLILLQILLVLIRCNSMAKAQRD